MIRIRGSISAKILMGYVSVFLILLIGAVTIYHATTNINKKVATFVDVILPEIDAIERLSHTKSKLLISAYSLYGTTMEIEEFDLQKETFHNEILTALGALNTHDTDLATSDINAAYTKFSQELDRLRTIMAGSAIDWDQARQILNELS